MRTMRRTGSITARSLGRQIFDPGATAGVTRAALQPHFWLSGPCGSPEPAPPAGCRAAGLALLFLLDTPPPQGKQGAKLLGGWRSKVDGRCRGERFFGELTLPRCQSSLREGLQLTSSSSCDETCLRRRQVLRAGPSNAQLRRGLALLAMTSCKPNRVV